MSYEYAYNVVEVSLWDTGVQPLPQPITPNKGPWELVRTEFVRTGETLSHTINKMPDYSTSKSDNSVTTPTYKMVVFWRRWIGPVRDSYELPDLAKAALF